MGGLLLFVGLAVLAFGLWNHMKGKRILAAPFKSPGELQKNPTTSDPKGAISTEGAVVPPAQALLSPCTKQPCLYYEVKIERMYEKNETTQEGTKLVKSTEVLETLKGGALFRVSDAGGAVEVDFSKGGDFDSTKKGFDKSVNGHSNTSIAQFGELSFQVPAISGSNGWTTGFKATETYVPAEGNLFVLGKLEGSRIVKPGWRAMVASSKGRDGLLGSINKRKKFSFIGGGVAAVLSIPLMIFAPKSAPSVSNSCNSAMTGAVAKCTDHTSFDSGETYSWTVEKAGTYDLEVTVPSKKIVMLPRISVKNAKGEVLADSLDRVELDDLQPGTYSINVKNDSGYMVKGGYDFSLSIVAVGGEAPAVAEGADEGTKMAPALAEEEAVAPQKKVAAVPAAHAAPKAAVKKQPRKAAKAGRNVE